MANVDETQRHESLPIESVTYEGERERKKEEKTRVKWYSMDSVMSGLIIYSSIYFRVSRDE